MKKRVVSIALLVAIMTTICMTSAAAVNSMSAYDSMVEIANMDVNTATPAMKQIILQAREEIIFSKTWTADGIKGVIIDADGEITNVPEFHDIFPDSWELPTFDVGSAPTLQATPWSSKDRSGETIIHNLFQDSVYLYSPSDTVISEPFVTVDSGFPYYNLNVTYDTIYTTGVYQFPSATGSYNVGYSDADTGESYGYAVNLDNADTFSITPPDDVEIDVRASSYDYPGTWSMSVTGYKENF